MVNELSSPETHSHTCMNSDKRVISGTLPKVMPTSYEQFLKSFTTEPEEEQELRLSSSDEDASDRC